MQINNLKTNFQSASSLGIPFPMMDEHSLVLVPFSDWSVANLEDRSSQIGYIIFMEDKYGNANCIDSSSRKSRRVVWWVLGSEIFAFADAVDASIMVRHDIQTTLNLMVHDTVRCTDRLNSN